MPSPPTVTGVGPFLSSVGRTMRTRYDVVEASLLYSNGYMLIPTLGRQPQRNVLLAPVGLPPIVIPRGL